jgi:hypothetical protein
MTKAKDTHIPSMNAAGALAVYDGQIRSGTIVEHDGEYFAFDSSGTLLGEFATLSEATKVIPNTDDCA